jgi:hypothetical protein
MPRCSPGVVDTRSLGRLARIDDGRPPLPRRRRRPAVGRRLHVPQSREAGRHAHRAGHRRAADGARAPSAGYSMGMQAERSGTADSPHSCGGAARHEHWRTGATDQGHGRLVPSRPPPGTPGTHAGSRNPGSLGVEITLLFEQSAGNPIEPALDALAGVGCVVSAGTAGTVHATR